MTEPISDMTSRVVSDRYGILQRDIAAIFAGGSEIAHSVETLVVMVSHLHADIDFAAVFDVEFIDIGTAQPVGDAARNPLGFGTEMLELIAVERDLQLATAAVHAGIDQEQTRDAVEPQLDLVGHLARHQQPKP